MVPFVYLTRYSEKINISSYSSSIIISIMNGLNAIGRISMGYMGDKYGHINILVISIFLSSLSILIIWLFSTTYILILIFAIIYGFISGSYWSLLVPICSKLTDVSNLINGINIIYFVNFIGYLIGIPIAELIFGLQTNTLNTFLILYCGILMLSASFCYLLLKTFSNKKMFIKV
jgi:MFS family permease